MRKKPEYIIARGRHSLRFILKKINEGSVCRERLVYSSRKEAEDALKLCIKPADQDLYRIFKI